MTVSATFEPGGAEPAWGAYPVKGNSTWRIGFRIVGVFTGRGNFRECKFYQNESGKLQWTIGDKSGEIVGKTPNAINKFEKATFSGDTWTLSYNDALGADYPVNSTSEMSITLSLEFDIKCVSSDGTSMSKHFKVEGSVKAQAAQKSGKPTLTNPMITYTPLP